MSEKVIISKKTFDILKNFQNINQSLDVKAGNIIKTIKPNKTVYAETEVDEYFPVDFAIYDLPQFLQTISLFEKPEIEFHDKSCEIMGNGGREGVVSYRYASPTVMDTIVSAKDINIKFPETEVEFVLPKDVLKKTLKAANVLNLSEVCFEANGEHIYISAKTRSKHSDSFRRKLAETDKNFEIILSVDNLVFLEHDYTVSIAKRFIKFTSQVDGYLFYSVGAEQESKLIEE